MIDDFIRVAIRISHGNLTSTWKSFEEYGYLVEQNLYR